MRVFSIASVYAINLVIGLVSDVEGFIPESTHVASTNNKLIRLRRTSARCLRSESDVRHIRSISKGSASPAPPES